MAEKINVAGLKAKGFGDSDFVLMGSVYPTNEEPSLALLLCLSESCAEMHSQDGKSRWISRQHKRGRVSSIPPVIARRNTHLSAKNLSEMARTGVADLKPDFDYAFIGFPEQAASLIHSQMNKVLRGCKPRTPFEKAAKMELAHLRLFGQPDQAKLLCQMGYHQIGNLPQLESG